MQNLINLLVVLVFLFPCVSYATTSTYYGSSIRPTLEITDSLTLTGFNGCSVLFSNSSSIVSQDNSNFCWDDTNDRLGIGTSTPTKELDVNGEATFYNSVGPYGELYYHNNAVTLDIATDTTFANVTGLLNGISSEITMNGANGTGTVTKPGVYNLKSSQSFTTDANVRVQHIVSVNGVHQPNCHSHRKVAANDIGNSGIACLIELAIGDVVRLMVNTPSARTVNYEHVGWHLKR